MPLILEAPDQQQRLELQIIGYEYPDNDRGGDDSNWLTIRIDAYNGEITWSAEDPALLTWDIERLAGWLDALALGQATALTCDFLEPCLAFCTEPLSKELTKLRVYFGYELYPPGRLGPGATVSDVCVEFELNPEQLRAASRSLRTELSRYPARGPAPDHRPEHAG